MLMIPYEDFTIQLITIFKKDKNQMMVFFIHLAPLLIMIIQIYIIQLLMDEKFDSKIIQSTLRDQSQFLSEFQKEVQLWENELAYTTPINPDIFPEKKPQRQLKIVQNQFESEFPIDLHKIQNNNMNSRQLLEATQLILKYQGQLKVILNQINHIKSQHMKKGTPIKCKNNQKQKNLENNKSLEQSIIISNQPQIQNYLNSDCQGKQISKASQKEQKTIRKVQKDSSTQQHGKKQIQNFLIIKEFQQNVQKIIYIKPPKPILKNFSNISNDSDSDVQQFLIRDYTPTPQIDSKINVQKDQSLLLIQLDVRSTLYQQLLPQINELSLSHKTDKVKGEENQNILQDKTLKIKEFVIDEQQAQNFQQPTYKVNEKDQIRKQKISRIAVVYNLKTHQKFQQPECDKNLIQNQKQVTEQLNSKIFGSQPINQEQIQQSLDQLYNIRRLRGCSKYFRDFAGSKKGLKFIFRPFQCDICLK
ncbi:hypothetical protein pb186bvf_021141, partial [Paramecium bursaria]